MRTRRGKDLAVEPRVFGAFALDGNCGRTVRGMATGVDDGLVPCLRSAEAVRGEKEQGQVGKLETCQKSAKKKLRAAAEPNCINLLGQV